GPQLEDPHLRGGGRVSIVIRGIPQLIRRIEALRDAPAPMLGKIQVDAVRYAKEMVPRKTGHLGRSITRGPITKSYAIVYARAGYAAYVELGTRPHVIRPRNKKFLRFTAKGAAARLSGAPTRGAIRKGGAYAFAREVHHPGTKPQPFLVPGARRAVEENAGREVIIRRWNDAA
ncbi:MAG TPA: HK97 gp10 family phage protein, partial [Propionicimonas sp.]